MVKCYDLRCKYCNNKYKCTNKNVELEYIGINTKYQGYKHLLKCKSFEYSDLYENAMGLLRKIEEEEKRDGYKVHK